jgi:hypothetical protein
MTYANKSEGTQYQAEAGIHFPPKRTGGGYRHNLEDATPVWMGFCGTIIGGRHENGTKN